jgi:branched-chain amino acid transport system permease protein
MTSTNRTTSLITLAVAVVLWFMPTFRETLDFPVFFLLFGYTLFFWIAQASSWNTFTGFSGYFSFGQGAFFGAGVYAVAVLAVKRDWPLLLTFIVGGLVAAVIGLIIGVVVFRLRELRGEIFALMTLAVAFVMASIARVSPTIDGGQGIPVNNVALPDFLGDFPTMIFRLGLIIATFAVIAAQFVQRSRLGWGLFSIRDDEDVAETLGVPTFRYKITALLLTSFIAGLSGAIHSLQIGYVTIEDVFSIRVPLFVILMSILGGTKHWMGPVVGAVVVVTLNDRLNRAGFQEISDFITGGLLILMIVAVKEGLYLRMRTRPARTAIGFALGLAIGFALGALDESLITLLAYGLGIAVLAVMLPMSWGPGGRTVAVEEDDTVGSRG